MALVKCPKCGESVSTTAKYCVHCGAAFQEKTCFECGSLLLVGEEVCGKCGANQNATAEERAVPAPTVTATVAATSTQAVAKEEPADGVSEEEKAKIEAEMTSIIQKRKDRDKKFNTWRVILHTASLIFIMFPLFIILAKLDDMAELPLYMRMVIWSENSAIVLFMLIIGSMSLLGESLIRIYTSLNGDKEQTQEMTALGKEKWRYYIKQNANKNRDKKEQAAFDNALRIGYLLENPDKKENPTLSIIKAVIGVCANVVWSILFVVILYGMYKLGMETGIGDGWKLLVAKLKDLLGPILMLLIIHAPFGIIGLVFESKIKKEAKLYQESILAEEKELKN